MKEYGASVYLESNATFEGVASILLAHIDVVEEKLGFRLKSHQFWVANGCASWRAEGEAS